MSSTSSDNDIAALVNQYATEASDEAIQAVEAIEATVHEAADAADEVADVGGEVMDIVNELSAGDRMAAVNAAMDLFDNETGAEVEEAVDALTATADAGRAALEEVVDVAGVFADAEAAIEDDIAQIELPLEFFKF